MIHLIFYIVLIALVFRLIIAPFHIGRHHRFYGGDRYGDDNPYRYGCRRHHGIVGSFLPILVLVALDRIFTGRRF